MTSISSLWNRFASAADRLRSGYWFVPTTMALGSVGLAMFTLNLDEGVSGRWLVRSGWVYAGGQEGARTLLSTVASSMITVAGVVFSITIVALTLAASQFGPRLLRNFIRDRGAQVVLGTFIATFIYCLLVLRTVRGQDGAGFLPHISVTVAVALALAGLGVLIYFIHHVATAIQVTNVITAVGDELQQAIQERFPERLGEGVEDEGQETVPARSTEDATAVSSQRRGYLQSVDGELLLRIAEQKDLVLQVCSRPGRFTMPGMPLLWVWSRARVTEPLAERLRGAFLIGPQPTLTQDVEFAVRQLVEVTVRALSPGINDPFTALQCIDQLGAALGQMASRRVPSPLRRGQDGRVRLVARPVSFAEVVSASFALIREYGRESSVVMAHLLDVLALVAGHARREEDRETLRLEAASIERQGRGSLAEEEQQALAGRHAAFLKALERTGRPG